MNLAETAELLLHLRLKDDASPAIKSAQTSMSNLDKVTQGVGSRFKGFGQSVKQGVAIGFGLNVWGTAAGAIHTVSDAIGDTIDAYKQQEVADAALRASLDANVGNWHQYQGAIDDAKEAAINLGFQDDEMEASLAKVVAATHDVKKGLDLMRAAEDLARLKHISLDSASDALIKVEAGRYRLLGELGIKLRDGATQEEALAAVRQAAAGQAIAYTTTLAGKQDILNAKLNEEQELIGQKLVPFQLAWNQALLDGVTAVDSFFSNYKEESQHLVEDPKNTFLGSLPSKEEVQAAIDRLKAIPDSFKAGGANENPIQAALFDLNVGGVQDKWKQQIADLTAYLQGTWGDQANELARSSQWQTPFRNLAQTGVETAAQTVERELGPSLAQGISRAGVGGSAYANAVLLGHNIGSGIVTGTTKGLLDDQGSLSSAISNLKDIIKNGLSPKELAAEASGRETIRLFRQGMRSEKTGAKEDAELLAGASIAAIYDAANNGVLGQKDAKAVGAYLGGLYNAGLSSATVDAILAAQGMTAAQIAAMHKQFPKFFNTGAAAAGQVNAGLLSKDWDAFGRTAARRWGAGFDSKINSILRNISGGGGLGEGGHPGGGGRQFGGPVNPYGTYVVGEGGKPELLTLGARGGWVTPLSGNRSGGVMAQPIQVTVLLNTRTVARELAREGSITYARTR